MESKLSASDAPVGAIVLAAGRSRRFRSARSKLVHPVGGRPLIQWPLGALRSLDIDPIVVVVGPGADEVRASCGAGVRFAVQSEPQGTGHAVLAAAGDLAGFRGSVLLVHGDLPRLRAQTLQRLVDAHRASRAAVTLGTGHVDDPGGWGRIVRADGRVRAIVEDRDANPAERAINEVNVGLYCVRAPLLFQLIERATPDNAQGEIYLTDIVALAAAEGLAVTDVPVDVAEVAQVNSRRELAAMEKQLRAEICGRWMDAGVTLVDPDSAYIDPEVTIGEDTIIGPNVHLRGRTSIGAQCRIDGSAFITDSTLAEDVHVKFGVVMTQVDVGARAIVGPFAHLRAHTQLGEEVHIGDFVETKNARLGRGAKANHLAYLGDADIGNGTNIGAGTITCNYDGFVKHRTVIGERVQVGSDTTLVAPVRVGDDAYIGAATTVRRDVSPGALAFNPRQQMERPGWVAGFRQRKTSGASAVPAAQAGGKERSPTAATGPRAREKSGGRAKPRGR
ncbi:MAG: bifunctional UDP-N-acetylglucosamine diphosphorylase/glucosamine-1-phosphate N-acetyltransferase GlmU [Candidatus Binatia bacterium]